MHWRADPSVLPNAYTIRVYVFGRHGREREEFESRKIGAQEGERRRTSSPSCGAMVLLFSEVDHESEDSNTDRGDGLQEVRIYRRLPNANKK